MSEHVAAARIETAAERDAQTRAIAALLALGTLICLIGAGGLMIAQSRRPAPNTLISELSHERMEAGFALYTQHCAACHGKFLSGAPGWQNDANLAPALNETGHAFNHSDLDLFTRVSAGARSQDRKISMPPFRALLSDDEIVTLLSYIAGWWPQSERDRRAGPSWSSSAICGPASGAPPSNGTPADGS